MRAWGHHNNQLMHHECWYYLIENLHNTLNTPKIYTTGFKHWPSQTQVHSGSKKCNTSSLMAVAFEVTPMIILMSTWTRALPMLVNQYKSETSKYKILIDYYVWWHAQNRYAWLKWLIIGTQTAYCNCQHNTKRKLKLWPTYQWNQYTVGFKFGSTH